MKPHGTYKIARRRVTNDPVASRIPVPSDAAYDPLLDPVLEGAPRLQRILDSLRS